MLLFERFPFLRALGIAKGNILAFGHRIFLRFGIPMKTSIGVLSKHLLPTRGQPYRKELGRRGCLRPGWDIDSRANFQRDWVGKSKLQSLDSPIHHPESGVIIDPASDRKLP